MAALGLLLPDLGSVLDRVTRAYSDGARGVTARVAGGLRGYQILAAAARPGQTQFALARTVGINPTLMTYSLDRLETDGLVERRQDPADRRTWRIALTATGRSTLNALTGELVAVEAQVLAPLSADEQTVLRGLLRRLALSEDAIDASRPSTSPSSRRVRSR